MNPGHSTDTPIPRGASSRRRPSDSATTRYLETLYALLCPEIRTSDRCCRDDVSTLAMLLDQRPENLDPPNGRHQVDAHGPIPRRLGPGAIRPTAADARVVDEDMHLAVAGSRGFGGRHEFGFE